MMAEARNRTLNGRLLWRRRLGVFACLLALALALFGHIETSEAVSLDAGTAIVTLAHADGPADHDGIAAPQHCSHQVQCSFHALLPSPLSADALAARRAGVSADRLGDSRAISPRGHPPKISILQ